MKESSDAVQHADQPSVQIGEPTHLTEHIRELYERIAFRASEIFEDRGRLAGWDQANWYQAEREFLHPLLINISESPEALVLLAEVPGFKSNDLEIHVEPRRVTITGKREAAYEAKSHDNVYSELFSDQILRAINLPAIVAVDKVTSVLKDGMLELDMPKADSISMENV
jgi:HSP20 family protein